MLCWGNAKDGQLGLGGDMNPIFEPRTCHVFSNRGLKEVACGRHHTVFLLCDGSVYTCGSNSCGQLGHDKPGTSPGRFSAWVAPSPNVLGYLKTTSCCISNIICFYSHKVPAQERMGTFVFSMSVNV